MAPDEIKKMTRAELLELARSKNLRVTSRMLKAELIEVIQKEDLRKKRKKAAGKRPALEAKAKAVPKGRVSKAPKVKAERANGVRKKKPKAAPAKGAVKKAAEKAPAARVKRLTAETIRQKAEAGKYYLGFEEKAIPPVEAMEVPPGYGIDRIVAMVRDPHWIFTYWEVTGERYRELEKLFGEDWPGCKMILRVFNRSAEPQMHFNIELNRDARNWYINVTPDSSYQVAIGALGKDGRFEEVAISNTVETPRGGISDVIDDRWMVPEEVFERIFAASGGYGLHAGSEELRELLERRLLEQISSGAVPSLFSGARREEERGRKFRLWVATELILYGVTEPDARVTIQGNEIKLRHDGTFSLRFALPDGKIDIPVMAVSPDGVEERSIDTAVRKKSKQKEPVLR